MKDTINKGNYELWKKEMKEWNECMFMLLNVLCFEIYSWVSEKNSHTLLLVRIKYKMLSGYQ